MIKKTKTIRKIEVPEDLQIEVLTKEQRWWRNIEDNCNSSLKQLKDSIILQEEIKKLAISKIEDLKPE